MNKRSAEINFTNYLDRELNIESSWQLPWHHPARESRELLPVVTRLAKLEFAAESPEQTALKARWVAGMSDVQRQAPERKTALRWARIWIPIFLLLAALLFAFRQPLQTVFANMLGYGYIEGVGFFKLDSVYVLSGPVMQQHEGESLTVLRGLSDAGETQLWLHASDAAVDFSGVWLETVDGTSLPVKGWQMLTDAAHSGEALLSFQPLTSEQMQVTLIFPAGWHLPLQFVSGAEWQDRANHTLSAVTVPYTTPTATIAPTVLNPCVSPQGFEVCVRDAAYSSDGLQVLLGSDAGSSPFKPISMEAYMGLVAVNPLNQDDQAVLEAGSKQSSIEVAHFPQGITQQGSSIQQALTFPLDASVRGIAKLMIPAFTAMVELSQPVMITVDLGPNPQPGQTVPLPADIQIAGHMIHFDSATIEGDGVNSLRLTLTSAPIETKDDWMVSLLELGKPEGIADRYGSGSIDADRRLKVFTELFDDNGKIKTGQLNLPVIDAVVLFTGPFEFTFTLPDAITGTAQQTPTIVSSDSFNPQPTPTPLSLDSYSYNNESLQANNLLFTVTHDTTTDLYAQQPDETTPRLIATLPGQVYQVYVHPDLQGIDYLAGTKVTVDYQEPYFKNAGLFSLNFGDAQPRLLVTFPTGPSSMQGGGTQVTDATWSADGQIMAFELNGLQAPQGQPGRKMGWIDLSCRQSGNCAIQYLNPPDPALDIYFPQFSPQGRTLLLSGVSLNGTGSGAEQIYLLTFGADGQPGELNKLTRSDMDDEENPRWMADGNSLLIECLDMNTDLNDVHLCQWNLSKGVRTELMDANDYLTRPPLRWSVLSPLDDLLVDMSLNQNQPELRIFKRETLTVNLIPQPDDLSGFVFTKDEEILYVSDVKGEYIGAVDLATMTQRTLYTQSAAGFISWIGVVNAGK